MVFSSDSAHVCSVESESTISLYDWSNKSRRHIDISTQKTLLMQFTHNSCILVTTSSESESQWCVSFYIDVLSDSARCVGNLNFPSVVLDVVLRKEYMCVVFSDNVSIYSIPNLHLMRKQPTFTNPGSACCSMSTNMPKLVFACLGMQRGTVRVERFSSPPSSSVIAAHDTSIVALALSGNGMFIATASEKGTLIRIHSTFDDCALVHEVRRSFPLLTSQGPKKDIRTLFMSPNGTFVGLVTMGGEICVYKLSSSSSGSTSALVSSTTSSDSRSFSNLYNRYVGSLSSTSPWFIQKIPNHKENFSKIYVQFGFIPFTLLVTVDSNLFIYRFDGQHPNKIVLARCDRITSPLNDSVVSDVSVVPYTDKEDELSSSPDWVVLSDSQESFSYPQQFW
jgi:hypothetical protein